MSEKKLFLLDAYALIYRSYFAFIRAPRINSKGLNTSAVFGFANTLLDVLQNEKPTHIAVAFDPHGGTFRNEIFPEYKAQRQEMPEDLRRSIPYVKLLIEAFNIPIIEKQGFEADDVIGTLSKMASEADFKTYMMTPDKDYAQLVSENVFMFKPKRGGGENEILGIEEVCKKYGISEPKQIIDILALWGDSSDNIPGAPGVGEKTSQKLIAEFESVENLFENIDKLKGKQKENIQNNIEQILLSKKLATIVTDVPVELSEEKFLINKPDNEKLKSLFDELEFKTLAKRLKLEPATVGIDEFGQTSLFDAHTMEEMAKVPEKKNDISNINHNYQLVDSPEKRKTLIESLSSLPEFCFDTETTSLDTIDAELVGLAFSWEKFKAFYVPIPENQDDAQKVLDEFHLVFENEKIRKIGQNIKFDILMLKHYNIEVKGDLFDTLIAHYILHPEQKHGLGFLTETYLNYQPVPIENLIGKKGIGQLSMRTVALEKITEYAGEDADITFQLKEILEKELLEKKGMDLFLKTEMPLIPVLAEMEHTGVKFASETMSDLAGELKKEIIDIEKDIYADAGYSFNISSPKQLGELLFDRLKIDEKAKKTKTGQYATSEEILVRLENRHPIIAKVLEYRGLRKLLSTYVEALPKLVNKRTGKIHTSYNQAVAATGRLSSNNPNLQNIPIREKRGRDLRKAFVPEKAENLFFSADYSQIELRLMAALSEDKSLIEAFLNKEDIHTATAAKIFKIDPSEVNPNHRSKAKTANFGIIYGISAFGLSQRLNIPRTEAKELIDSYFESYPDVKTYMDKSIELARSRGYVETIMGRKRMLRDINSRNATVRGNAERNAINAPIQGSAADIIKLAMINIHKVFQKEKLNSKMIIQVHDELNFDVLPTELDAVKEIVIREMENAVKLTVPFVVDYGIGKNWLEAH